MSFLFFRQRVHVQEAVAYKPGAPGSLALLLIMWFQIHTKFSYSGNSSFPRGRFRTKLFLMVLLSLAYCGFDSEDILEEVAVPRYRIFGDIIQNIWKHDFMKLKRILELEGILSPYSLRKRKSTVVRMTLSPGPRHWQWQNLSPRLLTRTLCCFQQAILPLFNF